MSGAAALGLILLAAAPAGSPPKADIARAKAAILRAYKSAMSFPDISSERRWLNKNVKPSAYIYLIESDPDDQFRGDALTFAYFIAPQKTLPTLLKLSKSDRDTFVRDMALNSVLMAIVSKRVQGNVPGVESVAILCLHGPGSQPVTAEAILSFCRTSRAKRALQDIARGPYSGVLRRGAQKALRGPEWDIGRP